MSKQYPGGVIVANPTAPSGPYETSTAPGIWTIDQATNYIKQGLWPTAGNQQPDAQFNYVTMLLHGDGTNGAQNNTFLDSSTNNFTITRNGNTTQGSFSPYGSNWSNYFASTNSDYLKNAIGITLGTGSFTFECWYNFPAGGGYFGCVGDDLYTTGIAFRVNSSGNFLITTNGSATSTFGTSNASFNTWHHVAFVRSSGTLTCYLDGVSQGTLSNSGNIAGAVTVAGELYSGTFYAGATGYISNLRVTNTAVYTSAFTPSTTPLTAISGTQFLSCQSNRFVDNSSNAVPLTANGSPTIQRFNPFGASTAYSTSTIGGSAYFDGNGDYLSSSATTALNFGTSDFTIEFWVYASSTSTFQDFFGDANNSGGVGVSLYSGTVYYGNQGISNPLSYSYAGYYDQWVHIAVARSSGTSKMFFNGAVVSSNSDSINFSSSTGVLLGKFNGRSNYVVGFVSDVRVVKGTALYTSAFTPPTTPLTAVSGTSWLNSMTNGAIYDNAEFSDFETVDSAQISTSVKKYGTGSLSFGGGTAALRSASNPWNNFSTAPFTIEAWCNFNNASDYFVIVARINGSGTGDWSFFYNYSIQKWRVVGGTSASIIIDMSNTWTPTVGTWYHVAVCRSGNNFYFFIDGVQQGTTQVSSATFPYNANFYTVVGNLTDLGTPVNGYIDDLRITKGYARYTTNFTPPTAAFPNTGPN
jgi:hypothetical protein